MMHQNKSKKILIYFFLLLIVGSINNKTFNKIKFFQIKNINITGLSDIDIESLLSNLNNITQKNILLINKNEISRIIENNSLVQNYIILKKYPSTLNIRIEKTKFLAKINKNNKIFYIGANGKLITNNSKNELPFIFGNPEINEFLRFKKIVDSSKINYKKIKNLYYFQSKRWDIEFYDNLIVKLPKENLLNSLDNAFDILNDDNFNALKQIDLRIKNQIITNE